MQGKCLVVNLSQKGRGAVLNHYISKPVGPHKAGLAQGVTHKVDARLGETMPEMQGSQFRWIFSQPLVVFKI